MIILGVDFHPEFQQITSVDIDTGEFQEKRLAHREEAEKFYRALAGQKVRVGMEASGQVPLRRRAARSPILGTGGRLTMAVRVGTLTGSLAMRSPSKKHFDLRGGRRPPHANGMF